MNAPISSTSNPKVKDLVQLLTKSRHRRQSGRMVVEGEREIARALRSGLEPLDLWVRDGVEPLEIERGFKTIYFASGPVFDKVAYRSATELAVATFVIPEQNAALVQHVLSNASRLLVLEGLEKPGNLGAVLRSSLASGIDAVLLADAALDPYSPNVVRNATGALFEQHLLVGTNAEVQGWLKDYGFEVAITHMHTDAVSLYDWKPADKVAVVLGEEARGLSNDWLDQGYENLVVPMHGDVVDSLNVSVAAAVISYHLDYLKRS